MGLQWNEFELPSKKLPKWQRTFAVDPSTGQVFIAAALTGDAEHLVWACASGDGLPTYSRDEHYYVPADWMASEFPNTKVLCDAVVASITQV
jgi:hypothetical protein